MAIPGRLSEDQKHIYQTLYSKVLYGYVYNDYDEEAGITNFTHKVKAIMVAMFYMDLEGKLSQAESAAGSSSLGLPIVGEAPAVIRAL